MFFPEDMTLQYFSFDTYPGYLLQMAPIALAAWLLAFLHRRRSRGESLPRAAVAALFPAYLAALLALTLLARFISDGWYILLYHQMPWPEGEGGYRWLTLVYDFKLDFFRSLSGENLGNILLFLPFGVLYPLVNPGASWRRTLLLGVGTSLTIELIQPLLDRSFDVNDLVLNSLGVALSTLFFYVVRSQWQRIRKPA